MRLSSRANVKEQPRGWNPTKEDVGKDRPSLKAVTKKAKRGEEGIMISAFADSLIMTGELARALTTGLSEGAYLCPKFVVYAIGT
eukprot:940464-Amphidinium_carterae.2